MMDLYKKSWKKVEKITEKVEKSLAEILKYGCRFVTPKLTGSLYYVGMITTQYQRV